MILLMGINQLVALYSPFSRNFDPVLTDFQRLPLDSKHNDKELLGRIAEGDEQAFAQLFNYYYPLLRPFIWKFTKSESDTEEVVQEIFMKIWLTRDKLTGIDNLNGWIYTLTSHQCFYLMRGNLNHRKKLNALQEWEEGAVIPPDDLLHVAEISRLVNKAIDLLPPQRQQIYRLSRESGLKPAEIAIQLSLSVNTVRNSLVSALKQIREYLEAAGHLLPVWWLCVHFL